MSFNGSGTFVVNSAGQPVVANTVISATVFNALTADLATGLSTCITKDGQTTVTANIPFGNNKITALGAGTAASDAANLGQVQSTAAKLVTVTGTDTITGTMSPALTAYAAGQLFYFIANAANTGAVTINIDGLGAKSITRDGSTALTGGDINSGEFVVIIYDGTRFQMINAANSFGNTTINGTLTVTGNTALQANVSITSTLSVGGTFAVTGAATLGSTLAVTGKSDLPTVSTASINAAVALITTGTVTNLTASGASIASANIGNLQFTAASIASINAGVAVVTNLTATSASIASMNAGVALVTTATITGLTATGASIASANVGTAVVTGMTVTGASIASVNAGVAVLSGNLTLNGGTANGVLYLNASKVATSGSALVFDGTNLGIGTASPSTKLDVAGPASAGLTNIVKLRTGSGNLTGLEIQGNYSTEDWLINNFYSGYIAFGTNNTERARITSAGNFGIGTTSPATKLTINQNSGDAVLIRSADTNYSSLGFGVSTSGGYTYLQSTNAGSGTIQPLTFWVGASERARIDTSGNFSLSTNATSFQWTNSGNNVALNGDSGILRFYTGTSAYNERGRFTAGGYFKASNDGSYDSSTGSYHEFSSDQNNHAVYVRATNASLSTTGILQLGVSRNTTNNSFYVISYYNGGAAAYRFRVADSGAIATAGGIALGTNTAATSGIGVQFPATQSASSDANTLDDYEEGTFDATLTPSTSGTITVNSSFNRMSYTKIGRQVTCVGNILISSVSSPVGGLVQLGGLPFLNSNLGEYSSRNQPVLQFVDSSLGTRTLIPCDMLESAGEFRIFKDASTFDTNDELIVTLTYFAAN